MRSVPSRLALALVVVGLVAGEFPPQVRRPVSPAAASARNSAADACRSTDQPFVDATEQRATLLAVEEPSGRLPSPLPDVDGMSGPRRSASSLLAGRAAVRTSFGGVVRSLLAVRPLRL